SLSAPPAWAGLARAEANAAATAASTTCHPPNRIGFLLERSRAVSRQPRRGTRALGREKNGGRKTSGLRSAPGPPARRLLADTPKPPVGRGRRCDAPAGEVQEVAVAINGACGIERAAPSGRQLPLHRSP